MRESAKVALGGIISALAVSVMLITYLSPFLVYTAPPFAGILLIIIVNELGYKWAMGTYVAISFLSVFLIADKEAAVFFTMFFGYYPVLRIFMDERIKNRFFRSILKWLIFNISVIFAVLICIFVFNIHYDDFSGSGYVFMGAFIVLANILFVTYDFLNTKLQIIYTLRLKKLFNKLFRY